MKKLKLLFSVVLITFLASCNDEAVDPALLNSTSNNNNNGNNGNTAGAITAKVDGVDFSSVTNSGTYTSLGTNTQLVISGATSDGKTITIAITNPAVGTVNASLSNCVLSYMSQGSIFTSTNTATSTSVGTVTITSFNTTTNRITGTFSFTGYNNDGTITRQIANGTINNFPFTNSVNNGGNNGNTASFTATIDGTNWTADGTLVYVSGNTVELMAYKGTESNPLDNFVFIIQGNTVGAYNNDNSLLSYSPQGSEYGWDNGYLDLNTGMVYNGSLSITAVDNVNHTISGTFSYTGYWSNGMASSPSKSFTNGVFTNLPFVTDDPNLDSFTGTLNGTDFVDTNVFTALIAVNNDVYDQITIQNANNDQMMLNFGKELVVGTSYPLNSTTPGYRVNMEYTPAGGSTQTAITGTIKVTNRNPIRTVGNFTFTTSTGNTVAGTFDIATP